MTAGTPKFHKKQLAGSFQLPNRYAKVDPSLFNGSCRFLDNKHIAISLIGRLRVAGSHQRFLARAKNIRIGTITVSRDATGRYYAAMQLASDVPFVQASRRILLWVLI